MSANDKLIAPPVTGASTLARPKFSPGLLLRDDDLSAGVDYTRNLSRLMFRSLFGCGVICGLKVDSWVECGKLMVTVESGVGLTCNGDPVQVSKQQKMAIDPTCGKTIPDTIWVTLCRTEKCCAPRTAACAGDDGEGGSVCTREQDGFEIRLVKVPPKDCICEELPLPNPQRVPPDSACWCADPCQKCHRLHYGGLCGCECCDGDCIVLAVLNKSAGQQEGKSEDDTGASDGKQVEWIANHSVRRFVRPVLMRDPVVHGEQYPDDEPCGGKAEPAEDRQQQVMMSDIAAADEAARRAAQAARSALRKGEEVRLATAAGRMVEAEAAAKAAEEMAVQARISAKAVAERAAEAAVTARREVKKIAAEREAVEKALAAKVAAEEAAAEQAAAEAVAAPEAVDQAPKTSKPGKKSGSGSGRKATPAKPAAP